MKISRTKTFYPPINERETEDLEYMVLIYPEDFQIEAVAQAKQELLNRGYSEEDILNGTKHFEKEKLNREIAHRKELEMNANRFYKWYQLPLIFFLSPFIILGKVRIGDSLGDLKEENFILMHRTRLVLLILGILFWILMIRALQKI